MNIRLSVLVLAMAMTGQAHALTHDQRQGAAIYAQHCANCHDDSKHMVGNVGPPLWGLMGRRVGSVPDFAYSPALRAANGEGHTWTLKRLDRFMTEPTQVYPGTSMPMAYAETRERKALIAYLATLRDTK
ncbi:MAG: c-type cytochrome [Asticcacaulis sp.]